jgi:hypothetical protein
MLGGRLCNRCAVWDPTGPRVTASVCGRAVSGMHRQLAGRETVNCALGTYDARKGVLGGRAMLGRRAGRRER